MDRCMSECMMNPPEPHSNASHTDAGPGAPARVPDYKPRDRLDPTWRPGTGVRAKMAPRSGAVPDDPWMYSQRSLREHRRLLPAQRIMLGLLLATGVAAVALVGFSMSGPDERQRWPAPARQAGMDENRSPPALSMSPEPAPVQAGTPQATPAAVVSAVVAVATPSVPEDAAGTRIVSAAASGTTLEPDAQTGMRPAPALLVRPVLAEQEQEPVAAQVTAAPLPPAAAPGGDDTRRARRPRTEAKSVACSEAQQAMQLCSITEDAQR